MNFCFKIRVSDIVSIAEASCWIVIVVLSDWSLHPTPEYESISGAVR